MDPNYETQPQSLTDETVKITEQSEIERLRKLAGPPAWAISLADQLSALITLCEAIKTAIEVQGGAIASMADSMQQVTAIGDKIPPGMLEGLAGAFGITTGA